MRDGQFDKLTLFSEDAAGKGVFPDMPRHLIPEGGVYTTSDMVVRDGCLQTKLVASSYLTPGGGGITGTVLYIGEMPFSSHVSTPLYFIITTTNIYFNDNATGVLQLRVFLGTYSSAMTADDVINVAQIDGTMVFSCNGKSPIQKLNVNYNGTDLGNSPTYKYVTVFADRVVGANLVDAAGGLHTPNQIGWSGNRNYTQWDPTLDVSAGFKPITEGMSNGVDPITGILGADNQMYIIRENSLWIATKQAIASDPFYVSCADPGQGIDCPSSIKLTSDGVIGLDYRAGCLVKFTNAKGVQYIGRGVIANTIKALVTTYGITKIRATYDKTNSEYIIKVVGDTTRFHYNEVYDAWTECNGASPNAIAALNFTKLSARDTGHLFYDVGTVIDREDDLSIGINAGFTSKDFELPVDTYLGRVEVDLDIIDNTGGGGSLQLDIYKNGRSDLSAAATKTVTGVLSGGKASNFAGGGRYTITLTKNIRARAFCFKLFGLNCRFKVLNYRLYIYPASERRKG